MPTTLMSTIHQTSCPKSSSVGWSAAASRFIGAPPVAAQPDDATGAGAEVGADLAAR